MGMRATGEGFTPSSPILTALPTVLARESGDVVSELNLGVPFDEEKGRMPVVRTWVVAGPARSNVG